MHPKIKVDDYKKIKKFYDALNLDKYHFINSNDICTPMGCVEEIVDKIPLELWSRKNLSILDPSCGNGNFSAYIYQKLLNRRNEIKNILYFNDLNIIRLENVKKIFGNDFIITKKDFLEFDNEKKYDLIISNPPYAKILDNGKRAAKNHNLSRIFIFKALQMIKDNGYIVFIVPDNWMSFSDRNILPRLLSGYQFIWLNIHGAKKWFPQVGSSFTWFILKKEENTKDFTVENFYKKNDITITSLKKGVDFIPLYYSNLVKSILEKTIYRNNEKFKIKTSSYLHKYTKKNLFSITESDEFKYKIIHTQSQTIWSKIPHLYQNTYKVFISLTSNYTTFVDNCGMTQSIAFIECANKNDAVKMSKVLMHPLYIFLNNICRFGNFNNIRVLQKFPFSGDENVYSLFNISTEEKRLINEINSRFPV